MSAYMNISLLALLFSRMHYMYLYRAILISIRYDTKYIHTSDIYFVVHLHMLIYQIYEEK